MGQGRAGGSRARIASAYCCDLLRASCSANLTVATCCWASSRSHLTAASWASSAACCCCAAAAASLASSRSRSAASLACCYAASLPCSSASSCRAAAATSLAASRSRSAAASSIDLKCSLLRLDLLDLLLFGLLLLDRCARCNACCKTRWCRRLTCAQLLLGFRRLCACRSWCCCLPLLECGRWCWCWCCCLLPLDCRRWCGWRRWCWCLGWCCFRIGTHTAGGMPVCCCSPQQPVLRRCGRMPASASAAALRLRLVPPLSLRVRPPTAPPSRLAPPSASLLPPPVGWAPPCSPSPRLAPRDGCFRLGPGPRRRLGSALSPIRLSSASSLSMSASPSSSCSSACRSLHPRRMLSSLLSFVVRRARCWCGRENWMCEVSSGSAQSPSRTSSWC